jgi:hypothetical protein
MMLQTWDGQNTSPLNEFDSPLRQLREVDLKTAISNRRLWWRFSFTPQLARGGFSTDGTLHHLQCAGHDFQPWLVHRRKSN